MALVFAALVRFVTGVILEHREASAASHITNSVVAQERQ